LIVSVKIENLNNFTYCQLNISVIIHKNLHKKTNLQHIRRNWFYYIFSSEIWRFIS